MTAWKGYSISWQSEMLSYQTDWIFWHAEHLQHEPTDSMHKYSHNQTWIHTQKR